MRPGVATKCVGASGAGSGPNPSVDGFGLQGAVIPAQTGIQSLDSASPKVCAVGSRFRGNDCCFRRPCPANDTTTAHH